MDASLTPALTPAPSDTDEYTIDLGDAADLTLGEGSARNENKRNPYN